MSYFFETNESQRRQYIDSMAVFNEYRRVQAVAARFRGGMIWREISGKTYLIKTSSKGAHQSLGPKSEETEKTYKAFVDRKASAEGRLAAIREQLEKSKRLNRAHMIGRVPQLLVNVLNGLEKAGVSDHFLVVSTHALYAYESAAGVRFMDDATATRDIDFLFDSRDGKEIKFLTQMKSAQLSFLGILKQADRSFERLDEKKETAINKDGFEIDVIRRMAVEGETNPLRLSDDEDDIWAVQAPTGGRILSSPRFSQMVVSSTGDMAMMNTMTPLTFVRIKRFLADLQSRDPLKVPKDRLQAQAVEDLVNEYLPQYAEIEQDSDGSTVSRIDRQGVRTVIADGLSSPVGLAVAPTAA